MKIEILIPTYNREVDLKKNLQLLISQIEKYKLENYILLSISDNNSTDNTSITIEKIGKSTNIEINLYRQDTNIGLEKNAIFLLEKSTSDFIMYLGDDDFLPEDYLNYLVDKINKIENLSCVIPGFSALYSNGDINLVRNSSFDEKIYKASFSTVMNISQYGHQLSGILLKRENLYKTYTKKDELRNIYPFVYFVAYNNLQGISIYAPKYQVLVSQSNSKDWSYDDSGLLTEIFKNYKILFNNSYMKRNIMNFVFMSQQSWRLRISSNLLNTYKSFVHIEKNKYIDFLTKFILPIFYVYIGSRMILSKIKRLLTK